MTHSPITRDRLTDEISRLTGVGVAENPNGIQIYDSQRPTITLTSSAVRAVALWDTWHEDKARGRFRPSMGSSLIVFDAEGESVLVINTDSGEEWTVSLVKSSDSFENAPAHVRTAVNLWVEAHNARLSAKPGERWMVSIKGEAVPWEAFVTVEPGTTRFMLRNGTTLSVGDPSIEFAELVTEG